MRTTSRSVTFRHPFTLKGNEEAFPAGTYVVETDEEMLDTVSLCAYRRLATWIRIPCVPGRPGTIDTMAVAPEELAAALAEDAELTVALSNSRSRFGH